MRGKLGTAVTTVVALLLGMFVTADAANVRVRCEKRADRSKISVDGNDLVAAQGPFTATATSGTNPVNSATAGPKAAIGDEAEFDFDSNANDVAAGATRISASFIQGNTVLGEIINAQNTVVASATVSCRVKN